MGVCEDVPSARRAVLPGSLGLFVRRRIVGTWPEVLDDMLKFYNYINPGYGLSLVDTLWNASSYRQPLEQEGNPMT